ncbi:VIT domain-containing protein [Phytomonospora sp. NPDC050363]|uniref:VIT domain-containing protein n=1 Tax=Phytomonospora sp. NPDC050363 TaxID=3155642 RepID=UPI003402C132
MSLTVTPLPVAPERAEPDPDAGLGVLRTERGNLPLRSLDVNTHITGLTARIEVVQGFHNPHDVPIEATYIFPLPDRAAVTAMRMTADGRTVEAELHEREQARAVYDQAIASGRRASIAEAERADVFTMRVGNILPGEDVTVSLTLSGPLSYEDGEATLRIPLVVAPRFIPGDPLSGAPVGDGTAQDTDAVPDASRITPPVLLPGFPNPVALSMETVVDPGGLPLSGARSSLHTVVTSEGEGGATVLRVQPGERVNRDFILRLAYGEAEAVSQTLACEPDEDNEGGTFQLTVLPPSGVEGVRPRDVVVLLDRSGSMSGWKMIAARRAAARIIDTLTTADRFALRCFDHDVESPDQLGPGLVEATDRHRYRAVEYLARADARGGTVLLEPLREAVRLLGADTAGETPRDRVLILVTDGQVGNEDQILAELAGGLTGVRVHVVGIDRAVNAGFLNRLAVTGRGRCELVESEDRLDEATARIHRRIASPVVTELSWRAEGFTPDQTTLAPTRVPDLFTGAPVVVSGRYHGQVAPDAAMHLSGQAITGDPWQATVGASNAEDKGAISVAWARAHLRDLEDRYAVGVGDLSSLEKQIVGVSLKHSVLCRFTAFVAVDSRVVAEGGDPHRVTQPVELPDGWEMPRPPAGAPMPQAWGGAQAGAPGSPAMTSQTFASADAFLERSVSADAGVDFFGAPPPLAPGSASAPPPPPAPAYGGQGAPPPPKAAPRRRAFARPAVQPPSGGGGGGVGGMIRMPGQIAGPDPHEAIRTQLAEELSALLAVPVDSTPEHERRDLLSDLASRLTALLTTSAVTSHPDRYATLRTLTLSLTVCDRPNPPRATALDALWRTTIETLTKLTTPNTKSKPKTTPKTPNTAATPPTGGDPTPPTETDTTQPANGDPTPPRRRAFWKRQG